MPEIGVIQEGIQEGIQSGVKKHPEHLSFQGKQGIKVVPGTGLDEERSSEVRELCERNPKQSEQCRFGCRQN